MKTSNSSVQPKLIPFWKTENVKKWRVHMCGHRTLKVVNCGQEIQQSSASKSTERIKLLCCHTSQQQRLRKPGQATHKDVVQNKNHSNVNIINMWPRKPSLSDEQFKKPATMYKHKYKKHQEEVICYDKQCQETK